MTTISLARGVPAPELLPVEEVADCIREVLFRDGTTLLNYGAVSGYAPLRAWVADRHGVDVSRVILTPGSLPAIVVVFQVLLAAGRRPLVEAPSYDRPLAILDTLGARPAAVPLTDDGLDLEALERELDAGPAFLYAIPTFQNPSGRTYTDEARRTLVEFARARDLLVVEDDPYRLVHFGAEPPPTLFELAGGDAIVYASSFSKVVAPGLRVGYVIVPPHLVEAVEQRAVATYLSPALSLQAALHEFIERGHLEPTLARVRAGMRERCEATLVALEEHLGGAATWSRPDGGYFVWLELPDFVPAAVVTERARTAGVGVVTGTDFYPGGVGGGSSLRLAYSFASAGELADGISRLARAIPAPAAV